jgi:hypothetical protein
MKHDGKSNGNPARRGRKFGGLQRRRYLCHYCVVLVVVVVVGSERVARGGSCESAGFHSDPFLTNTKNQSTSSKAVGGGVRWSNDMELPLPSGTRIETLLAGEGVCNTTLRAYIIT